MKILLFVLCALFSNIARSQGTGTVANPFQTLGMALTVPSAGIYYFNLTGTTFSSYVLASGYVQVAIDYGNGTGNLPQGTALNNISRGILNPTVLAKLNGATDVRIISSAGSNVNTTNATIISRLASNQTLHRGVADNGINNTWLGTNPGYFTGLASCTSTSGTALQQNIFHPCGNAGTFHWVPGSGVQRDPWSSGEIGNTQTFTLWVRDNSSPLPIELINFHVTNNDSKIDIAWQTASERNNDYFTLEKSAEGKIWNTCNIQPGAGNSVQLLPYSARDENPYQGISYYRLKQTDFDGKSTYSDIKSIDNSAKKSLILYPIPSSTDVFISGLNWDNLQLLDVQGRELNLSNCITKISDHQGKLNVRDFEKGVYFIKTESRTHKFIVD